MQYIKSHVAYSLAVVSVDATYKQISIMLDISFVLTNTVTTLKEVHSNSIVYIHDKTYQINNANNTFTVTKEYRRSHSTVYLKN